MISRRISWANIGYRVVVSALIFIPVVTFTSLWNSQYEIKTADAASGYTVLASSNDYSRGASSIMAKQISLKNYYGYRTIAGWPSGSACGRSYMSAPWLPDSNSITAGGNCNVDSTDGGGSGSGVWMPANQFAGWALMSGTPGFGSASVYPVSSTIGCNAIPGGSAAFIWGAGGPDISDQAYGPGGLMVVNKGSSSGGGYHMYSNGTTLFRATFNISTTDWAKPGSINLYSVADDWFDLYVNGVLVGRTINSKDSINDDLRPYLHTGTNVIAMQVSDKAVWGISDNSTSRQSGICYNLAIGPSSSDLSINVNPRIITPDSTTVTATANSSKDYSGRIAGTTAYRSLVSKSPTPNTETTKHFYYLTDGGDDTYMSITRFIIPPNGSGPSGSSSTGNARSPSCGNFSYSSPYSCQLVASKAGESGTLSASENWSYNDSQLEPGTKVCYIATTSLREFTEHTDTTKVLKHHFNWVTVVDVPAHDVTTTDPKTGKKTTTHVPAVTHQEDQGYDYWEYTYKTYRQTTSTWDYEYSAPACTVVVQIPFTHVTGNDLRVGSALRASSNPSSSQVRGYILRLGGSSSEYGILASGAVSGVGSSSGGFIGSSSSGNSLTFANSGSLGSFTSGAGMGSVPDVSTYSNNSLKSVTTMNVGGGNLSGIMSGYNLSSFDGSVVLKVNGSTTIDRNVIYAPTPSANGIPQQLVIIASGNINISSNVGRVDAWLVAMNGSVDTCSDYDWSSLRISNCNTPLTINGPIMSKQLLLKRTYFDRNSSVSAETLDLRGDAYVWANQVSRANGDWLTTYTTDLPPRF